MRIAWQILALGLASLLAPGMVCAADGEPLPPGRGGKVKEKWLHSYTGGKGPVESPQKIDAFLGILRQQMPPLTNERGDRWPLLLWGTIPERLKEACVERGLGPLLNYCSSPRRAEEILPTLRYFSERGVPLVILPQGWMQRAFTDPPRGAGADHLPPARPHSDSRDFTCPGWMHENPAVQTHAENARRTCRFLRENGIRPAALFLDFESGAYLRNIFDREEHVRAAMEEALKCPRCLRRFGAENMDSLQQYRQVVNRARAHAIRTGFTDPVRAVFPNVKTGNFFAYPRYRLPRPEGRYPAYGWKGSGMDVAQPRCYFVAGWGGNGRSVPHVSWNVFSYCLRRFSRCAGVLEDDETMVPWVGYLFGHAASRKKAARGAQIASSEAYREMVRHVMLRGAETLAIFNPYELTDRLPDEYEGMERAELGPWMLNVRDIQQAYDEMLAFNDILRSGRPLNLDLPPDTTELDERTAIWSGVATEKEALVRTVSFGPELSKTIVVFGRKVELPFGREGRFFRLTPDGQVRAQTAGTGRTQTTPGTR